MHHPCLRLAALSAALWPTLSLAAPLTLDAALELAVRRSETVRSARAEWASVNESARAAAQLPDPILQVGIDNLPATGADRLRTTRESMTMKRIGLSQEWLDGEKRAARQAAADAAAQREQVASQAAVALVRLNTAMAYLDAYYADQLLAQNVRLDHHAEEEFDAARARLVSSTADSQQVLALQGARGLAMDETGEARQRLAAATLALQRWIGVEGAELSEPGAWAIPAQADYVAAHPAVLLAQREVDAARTAAAAAASERRTNWTWQLSYGQRSGYSDLLSFGVSIPLPVAPAQRQDRETAARLARVEKAQADMVEARRQAETEYRSLRSDLDRLEARVASYLAAVVKPAGQRSAAALAAYRSNQMPLIVVFEARHAELQAQRRLLVLHSELAKTKARLAFTPVRDQETR